MPDVNTPLVSMAQQFTGLPMKDLIGAPLMAAAEANNMMSVSQTRFLLDTAFAVNDAGKETESYAPIMICMTLTRGVLIPADTSTTPPTEAKIEQVETKFDLPLLTILPLNSLAVDDVTIKFDMEVKSSFGETTSEKTEEKMAGATSFTAKIGYGFFSAEVTGSASYDKSSSSGRDAHYEKSNSAQYSVSVHAGQLPLPDGVKTIITAFTNAITPITMPTAAAA
ncbi:DUF2589 domain-containing protein [Sphingomonas sp. ABOLD]|uniref:DUF2589 domain-containing protein n=1 Tax=Sphingomonas trueperi TaxID=53317 RepID=A0A7X5Y0W4_9SPHN|nr:MULTISPECIES: DUF2589 domain-containing protein [Sphingomonas]NJB98593.1 hypothetical protein [Sphingomonas trueperi]RSV40885.1 DUF2589 domain-containing protein [Sphingomonas sp. ABOLE]RSV44539.1 DUF2589 domain-containing protein [Sphingomonas sp. ABOLD]